MPPKSERSRDLRALLVARQTALRHALKIENTIRGTRKALGIKLPTGRRTLFEARVHAALDDRPSLLEIVEPLLAARQTLCAGV